MTPNLLDVLEIVAERADVAVCGKLWTLNRYSRDYLAQDSFWNRKCLRDCHIPDWSTAVTDWKVLYQSRLVQAQEWRPRPRTLYVAPLTTETIGGEETTPPSASVGVVLQKAGISAIQLRGDPKYADIALFDDDAVV